MRSGRGRAGGMEGQVDSGADRTDRMDGKNGQGWKTRRTEWTGLEDGTDSASRSHEERAGGIHGDAMRCDAMQCDAMRCGAMNGKADAPDLTRGGGA